MGKFLCEHCGHRFESETKESVVCPNCFWSSSVKEEEAKSSRITIEESRSKSPFLSTRGASPTLPRTFVVGGGVLLVFALVGVIFFAAQYLLKQDQMIQRIASKNAREIASQAPELALLPEEKEVLNRKIVLSPDRKPSPAEKEVLERRIPLRSRSVPGLPTPPWDELQFETFLKSQEFEYKLPLERSYRRKIKNLFKLHYVTATAAFDQKDFIKARDEWIRSLAFPIYKNNVEKHRGVILTMLRPYINDTLSRIGLLNAILVEKESSLEAKIKADYGLLLELLQKGLWEEANAKLLELQKDAEHLDKTQGESQAPPPLPKEINLVDADIRQVLLSQAAPTRGINPGWEMLRRDLVEKEQIIQNYLLETLESVQADYRKALSFIESGNWAAAQGLLQNIRFPAELAEDARAKIKILDKLIPLASTSPEALDSQRKTG